MVVVVIVGIGGSYLVPNLEIFDNLVPTVMLRYLPVVIYSIVGVAAIVATQSTAASSLQSGVT